MWKIKAAIIFAILYMIYLLFCGGDQCLIAQEMPFTKVILQTLTTAFFLMSISGINFIAYQKQAKKGVPKSQFATAKNFFKGSGCKIDKKKSYFWAYIFMNSNYITPFERSESQKLLDKLSVDINYNTRRIIQSKAEKYIIRFKENPTHKNRKHEADISDLIKSTIILIVLIVSLSAIPIFFMHNTFQLMFSNQVRTDAFITGHVEESCFSKRLKKKECVAPIFEFRDEYGKVVRTIGTADKENFSSFTKSFDKVPIIYQKEQPLIAVSEKAYMAHSVIIYFFGFMNIISILSHFYICALNFKYRQDDKLSAKRVGFT